jgi:hypothetical protein
MDFNPKLLEMNQKIFDLVSVQNITFLNELDNIIDIIKMVNLNILSFS